MPAGNGRNKTKGRYLDVLSLIKNSIVVKTAFLCLARALIIAMARVNGDPKYTLYRHYKGFLKNRLNIFKFFRRGFIQW
jgi:hypothetical protein